MSSTTLALVWWILFLPLAGSLFQALFGKRIIERLGIDQGRRAMGIAALIPVAIPFVLGLVMTFGLVGESPASRSHIATLYDWITIQSIRIPFETLIDPLSMTMVLIITGIGALIHLYATGYMGEERDYSRFFTYLNLFISCMLILVLANNLVLMFIGWEGVGLCSYLLIAFWYTDISNARAGNKAFIVNRIGDWGLTLGIFAIFSLFAANAGQLGLKDGRLLSYDVVLPRAVELLYNNPTLATAIALLLFIGACGKSAQFPLYFWLPDAMAGPTPVSALIHAATMVTAGVFLVNRLHTFYELSAVASAVVACIGAFTALFAALIAFGQTDIKKVLAYSTVSQLGFMFVACGAGGYWAGMFHVTTHAFFKALLFLGAGAVIHAMVHNQDMRNYGNLLKYLKITGWTMIVGWFAISGVPGLSGYFSKEAIIGNALGNSLAVENGINFGVISGWVALFVAMLTAWYMTRMSMLTFFGKEERWRTLEPQHHVGSEHEAPHHELDKNHEPREVPISMWLPLVLLAAGSVLAGFFMKDNFQNWLYPTNGRWLYSNGEWDLLVMARMRGEPEHLFAPLWLLSIIAALLGLIAGYIVYRNGLPKTEGWDLRKWHPFRRSAANQFGYDAVLVNAGVEGGREVGVVLWQGIDSRFIDRTVNGVGWLAMQFGRGLRVIQTGYVRNYAMMMTFGGILILGIALATYLAVGR